MTTLALKRGTWSRHDGQRKGVAASALSLQGTALRLETRHWLGLCSFAVSFQGTKGSAQSVSHLLPTQRLAHARWTQRCDAWMSGIDRQSLPLLIVLAIQRTMLVAAL